MQGYIKLYRKTMNSPIWQDPYYFKLWMYCLMKATHKEHDQLVGNKMITLKSGEFITGRNVLADELNKGMKPSQKQSEISWWRYLNNLQKWEMLNIKKTNKYSVVSIVKWCEYQEIEQQVNNKRTTDEQQMNTNKNGNNGENGNKNTSTQIENLRQRYSTNQLNLIDDYFDMLRHTRKSAKISDNVILKIYQKMNKFPPICVEYGVKTHTDNPAYHSKQENYTLGIIRNTTSDEAHNKLNGNGSKKEINWEDL